MSDETKTIQFKPFFERKYGSRCNGSYDHKGPFLIDEQLATVECGTCQEQLNPIYVLKMLMNKECRYHDIVKRHGEVMREINHRSKTKCEHCKKMTSIRGLPRLL